MELLQRCSRISRLMPGPRPVAGATQPQRGSGISRGICSGPPPGAKSNFRVFGCTARTAPPPDSRGMREASAASNEPATTQGGKHTTVECVTSRSSERTTLDTRHGESAQCTFLYPDSTLHILCALAVLGVGRSARATSTRGESRLSRYLTKQTYRVVLQYSVVTLWAASAVRASAACSTAHRVPRPACRRVARDPPPTRQTHRPRPPPQEELRRPQSRASRPSARAPLLPRMR